MGRILSQKAKGRDLAPAQRPGFTAPDYVLAFLFHNVTRPHRLHERIQNGLGEVDDENLDSIVMVT